LDARHSRENFMSVPNPAAVDWVPLWPTGISVPPTQPSTCVWRAAAFNVAHGAWTAIPFDTVRYDNGGQWNAGQPTRLTAQVAGTHSISGVLEFLSQAGGAYRLVALRLNGGLLLAQNGLAGVTVAAGSQPRANPAFDMYLNVGEYVELVAYQDSGSPCPAYVGTNEAPEFSMALVGGMQGPPGVGVPTPVVNGQWLKGVGGAVVWAAITPADIANIPYGTSLPASPYDGQEAVLVDSISNPSYQWRFRYNAGSASSYKWEFIGGSPKIFNYDAGGALMNNAAFSTASGWFWWVNASGSVFPVQRPGDYNCRCKLWVNNSGATQNMSLGVLSVTAAPAVAGAPNANCVVVTVPGGEALLATAGSFGGLTVGFSIGMGWNATTPSQGVLKGAWVEITPSRVS
jgi:hypothetical protein